LLTSADVIVSRLDDDVISRDVIATSCGRSDLSDLRAATPGDEQFDCGGGRRSFSGCNSRLGGEACVVSRQLGRALINATGAKLAPCGDSWVGR